MASTIQDDPYLRAIAAEVDRSKRGLHAVSDDDRDDALPDPIRIIDAPPPEPTEWLIDDLWTLGDLGLIVGDGGSFKSSAALHMAAAIAGGYRVFDKYPTRQGPVFILSAEDRMPVIQVRLEAFIRGHGWDRTKVMENIHVIASDDPSLADDRWKVHLARHVEALQPRLLILDPWAELLGGDENSNTDVRPVVKYIRKLGRLSNGAPAVVHHAGKQRQDQRVMDRIRGASALPSASRVTFFFEFRADGVYVENLKLSKAPRLDAFVIRREIESEPRNRAMWTKARLTVLDAATLALTRAEDVVLEHLWTAHPRRINTRGLRALSEGVAGLDNNQVSSAITRLETVGKIDQIEGPHRAKMWGLTAVGLAVAGRVNGGETKPPRPPESRQLSLVRDGSSFVSESELDRARRIQHTEESSVLTVLNELSTHAPDPRMSVPPLGGGTHSGPESGSTVRSALPPDQPDELDRVQDLIDDEIGRREDDEE